MCIRIPAMLSDTNDYEATDSHVKRPERAAVPSIRTE